MSKQVKDYIQNTKKFYKDLDSYQDKVICLIRLEKYLDAKGYNETEIENAVNEVKEA